MAHFPPNLVSKFTRFATVYKTILPNFNHYFYQFETISNAILQLASSWLKYIAGPRLESYFISILSIPMQHNLFRQQKADTNHTQMLNQQNQFISPNHGM